MIIPTYQELAVLDQEAALLRMEVGRVGLTTADVAERKQQFGENILSSKRVHWITILLRQFKSAFIYLLLAASMISFFLGDSKIDSMLIFLFLVLNAALGFVQEYRAENALQLLKGYVDRKTRVRREGKEVLISVKEVVPGDIILLDAGDTIPADGYFLKAEQVEVDESSMTGETMAVKKSGIPVSQAPSDMYQATNIGFSRTTLVSGDAELLVFATGASTQVGEISEAMEKAESPSAFEEGINRFSKFILRLVLATIPLVFMLKLILGHDTVDIAEFLLFSIALTVSVIPEALPLVTTLSLSRGALLLAKKQVVPRRLSAIEDLGSINILCTDKTGTITENKLAVSDIYGNKDEVVNYALMSPLSNTEANSSQNIVFDKALFEYIKDEKNPTNLVRIDALPFDPIRRRETVLVKNGERLIMVMRGAPENVYGNDQFDSTLQDWVKLQGSHGCRILAIAFKEVTTQGKITVETEDEKDFTVVGMIAFSDPLKPSSRHALTQAKKLGVRVKIITGDSREVAGWVGVEAGIIDSVEQVITGDELMQMSEIERLEAVVKYDVFARTLPLQKYEIIQLLEKRHLVGFLGEGFNDAPALKIAHVGLAVENASDIAQDAADVILLNKSLDVIVDGIKEGRVIFANSMKYLRATLASNFGNFYALAFASLFIPYLPMLPIQVLLLNLLSDFPMISISTDNVDEEELRSPKGYQVAELTSVAVVLGVISTLFDFSFFGYFVQFPDEKVLQTMWFIGSILTELVVLFSIRTTLPFWKAKRPSLPVVMLTGVMGVATVLIPFIPKAQEIFGFVAPRPEYLVVAFALVVLYFVSNEVVKLLFYRWWNAKETRHAGIDQ